jgi:hypothetical protein
MDQTGVMGWMKPTNPTTSGFATYSNYISARLHGTQQWRSPKYVIGLRRALNTNNNAKLMIVLTVNDIQVSA